MPRLTGQCAVTLCALLLLLHLLVAFADTQSSSSMPFGSLGALDNNGFCPSRCPDTNVLPKLLQSLGESKEAFITLKPEDVLRGLAGRTWWLLGDSTMMQFYQSLACFLKFNPDRAVYQALDGAGPHFVAQSKENATINGNAMLELQAADELVPTASLNRILRLASVHGNLPVLPRCVYLQHDVQLCAARCDWERDVSNALGQIFGAQTIPSSSTTPPENAILARTRAVVNFGLHYRTHTAFSTDILAFSKFVQRKRLAEHIVWATSTPQHFDTDLGDPFSLPMGLATPNKSCTDRAHQTWLVKPHSGPYNAVAITAMRRAGVRVLDDWNDTLPIWFTHNAQRGDCTHSCSPGIYEVRVLALARLLNASSLEL